MEKQLNQQLYKFICKDYKVAAILYGGSHTLRLNTPESDCDLTVLLYPEEVAKSKKEAQEIYNGQTAEYIYYKDQLIHWYYTSPDCWENNFYHFDLWIIEAAFGYKLYMNVLYLQDVAILESYFRSVKQYLPTALTNCLIKYNHIITKLIQAPVEQLDEFLTKEIYHLCVINILLKQGKLTSIDRTFLQTVKQHAKQNAKGVIKEPCSANILLQVKANIQELIQNAEDYKKQYRV